MDLSYEAKLASVKNAASEVPEKRLSMGLYQYSPLLDNLKTMVWLPLRWTVKAFPLLLSKVTRQYILNLANGRTLDSPDVRINDGYPSRPYTLLMVLVLETPALQCTTMVPWPILILLSMGWPGSHNKCRLDWLSIRTQDLGIFKLDILKASPASPVICSPCWKPRKSAYPRNNLAVSCSAVDVWLGAWVGYWCSLIT